MEARAPFPPAPMCHTALREISQDAVEEIWYTNVSTVSLGKPAKATL